MPKSLTVGKLAAQIVHTFEVRPRVISVFPFSPQDQVQLRASMLELEDTMTFNLRDIGTSSATVTSFVFHLLLEAQMNHVKQLQTKFENAQVE